MKRFSILVIMFIAISTPRPTFGQTQSSTEAPQTTPNKPVSTAPKQHKKTAHKTSAEAAKDTKAGKPDGKVANTTSQEAGYALSGHKSAPEGSPHRKQ